MNPDPVEHEHERAHPCDRGDPVPLAGSSTGSTSHSKEQTTRHTTANPDPVEHQNRRSATGAVVTAYPEPVDNLSRSGVTGRGTEKGHASHTPRSSPRQPTKTAEQFSTKSQQAHNIKHPSSDERERAHPCDREDPVPLAGSSTGSTSHSKEQTTRHTTANPDPVEHQNRRSATGAVVTAYPEPVDNLSRSGVTGRGTEKGHASHTPRSSPRQPTKTAEQFSTKSQQTHNIKHPSSDERERAHPCDRGDPVPLAGSSTGSTNHSKEQTTRHTTANPDPVEHQNRRSATGAVVTAYPEPVDNLSRSGVTGRGTEKGHASHTPRSSPRQPTKTAEQFSTKSQQTHNIKHPSSDERECAHPCDRGDPVPLAGSSTGSTNHSKEKTTRHTTANPDPVEHQNRRSATGAVVTAYPEPVDNLSRSGVTGRGTEKGHASHTPRSSPRQPTKTAEQFSTKSQQTHNIKHPSSDERECAHPCDRGDPVPLAGSSTGSTNHSKEKTTRHTTANPDPVEHQNRRSATGAVVTAYPEPVDNLSRSGVTGRGTEKGHASHTPRSSPRQPTKTASNYQQQQTHNIKHPSSDERVRAHPCDRGDPVPLAGSSTGSTNHSKEKTTRHTTANPDPVEHQNRRSATGAVVTAYPEPVDNLSRSGYEWINNPWISPDAVGGNTIKLTGLNLNNKSDTRVAFHHQPTSMN
ncbi:uncharacterized protein LOC128092681 [Culex pipiens pallens]|uniref:uncharacterized protein LOC128092681 n=1 Tax=Culex pipiens pallens TaxID=42434 RepID=UPI0022AA79D4|nr:uncharacterized protein LOC128092681 [Culex pipiens pallens]